MVKCSMDENGRDDVAVGPVVSEGGRSPSALSTGQGAPPVAGVGTTLGPLAPGQRWSAARKREVVLRLMRGESAELLSRELGLPVFKLEQWRRKAEAGLEGALKEREADPADGQLAAALQRIGELSMENELLRAKLGALPQGALALWPAGGRDDGGDDLPEHRPSLRRRAGLPRLGGCAVLVLRRARGGDRARRALDAPWAAAGRLRRGAARRQPEASEAVPRTRADLARSPWTGEGHRKVWARLRAMDGIRVSRKRVLRLMRAHALLSPHRARPRPEAAHDRRIVTEAPNIMWATDATQITTVQDGKVWLFGVAEHWNAELLGWHVAKHGTRYEAIQALGMAVRRQFGHLGAGAARGLALRHDHGSNFMSDAFQKQIRFWGVAPSYAFVGEPETNGCIERLFRTLKGLGHCPGRSCTVASSGPSTTCARPSAPSSPATTPSG
jgi:putative transposase